MGLSEITCPEIETELLVPQISEKGLHTPGSQRKGLQRAVLRLLRKRFHAAVACSSDEAAQGWSGTANKELDLSKGFKFGLTFENQSILFTTLAK